MKRLGEARRDPGFESMGSPTALARGSDAEADGGASPAAARARPDQAEVSLSSFPAGATKNRGLSDIKSKLAAELAKRRNQLEPGPENRLSRVSSSGGRVNRTLSQIKRTNLSGEGLLKRLSGSPWNFPHGTLELRQELRGTAYDPDVLGEGAELVRDPCGALAMREEFWLELRSHVHDSRPGRARVLVVAARHPLVLVVRVRQPDGSLADPESTRGFTRWILEQRARLPAVVERVLQFQVEPRETREMTHERVTAVLQEVVAAQELYPSIAKLQSDCSDWSVRQESDRVESGSIRFGGAGRAQDVPRGPPLPPFQRKLQLLETWYSAKDHLESFIKSCQDMMKLRPNKTRVIGTELLQAIQARRREFVHHRVARVVDEARRLHKKKKELASCGLDQQKKLVGKALLWMLRIVNSVELPETGAFAKQLARKDTDRIKQGGTQLVEFEVTRMLELTKEILKAHAELSVPNKHMAEPDYAMSVTELQQMYRKYFGMLGHQGWQLRRKVDQPLKIESRVETLDDELSFAQQIRDGPGRSMPEAVQIYCVGFLNLSELLLQDAAALCHNMSVTLRDRSLENVKRLLLDDLRFCKRLCSDLQLATMMEVTDKLALRAHLLRAKFKLIRFQAADPAAGRARERSSPRFRKFESTGSFRADSGQSADTDGSSSVATEASATAALDDDMLQHGSPGMEMGMTAHEQQDHLDRLRSASGYQAPDSEDVRPDAESASRENVALLVPHDAKKAEVKLLLNSWCSQELECSSYLLVLHDAGGWWSSAGFEEMQASDIIDTEDVLLSFDVPKNGVQLVASSGRELQRCRPKFKAVAGSPSCVRLLVDMDAAFTQAKLRLTKVANTAIIVAESLLNNAFVMDYRRATLPGGCTEARDDTDLSNLWNLSFLFTEEVLRLSLTSEQVEKLAGRTHHLLQHEKQLRVITPRNSKLLLKDGFFIDAEDTVALDDIGGDELGTFEQTKRRTGLGTSASGSGLPKVSSNIDLLSGRKSEDSPASTSSAPRLLPRVRSGPEPGSAARLAEPSPVQMLRLSSSDLAFTPDTPRSSSAPVTPQTPGSPDVSSPGGNTAAGFESRFGPLCVCKVNPKDPIPKVCTCVAGRYYGCEESVAKAQETPRDAEGLGKVKATLDPKLLATSGDSSGSLDFFRPDQGRESIRDHLLHSRVTLFTKSDSKFTVELAECKAMRELFQLKQGAMSASATSRLVTYEIDFQNLDAARHAVLQKLLQAYCTEKNALPGIPQAFLGMQGPYRLSDINELDKSTGDGPSELENMLAELDNPGWIEIAEADLLSPDPTERKAGVNYYNNNRKAQNGVYKDASGKSAPPQNRAPVEMGKGGSAVVLRAYHGDHADVAVKRFFSRSTPEFKLEVATLQQLRHTNIVQFYGAVTRNASRCIVMELCKSTLTKHLAKYGSERIEKPAGSGRTIPRLTFKARVGYALQAARGMAFLHKRKILHRDLKCDNMLVTKNGQDVKLCDFSLSQRIDEMSQGQNEGTPGWMPPEVVTGGEDNPVTTKSDVYCFGIVLWELLTGKWPFEEHMRRDGRWRSASEQSLAQHQIHMAGLRPDGSKVGTRGNPGGVEPPSYDYAGRAEWFLVETGQGGAGDEEEGGPPDAERSSFDDYCELMRACWATLPAHRPTFENVVEILDLIREKRLHEVAERGEDSEYDEVADAQLLARARTTAFKKLKSDTYTTGSAGGAAMKGPYVSPTKIHHIEGTGQVRCDIPQKTEKWKMVHKIPFAQMNACDESCDECCFDNTHQECCIVGCNTRLGKGQWHTAHVMGKDERKFKKDDWWLVPTCAKHNNPSNAVIKLGNLSKKKAADGGTEQCVKRGTVFVRVTWASSGTLRELEGEVEHLMDEQVEEVMERLASGGEDGTVPGKTCTQPDAMVRVVPTDAATVKVPGGQLTLHLPAGSVRELVEIVIRRLPANHEAAAHAEAEADLRSDVWSLEPHGLQLLNPATLTLALTKPGCEHVAVLRRDEAVGADWDVLDSKVENNRATTELKSFSHCTVGGCVVHCRVRPTFSVVRLPSFDGPTLIATLEAAVHHAHAAAEAALQRADSGDGVSRFSAESKQLFEEGSSRERVVVKSGRDIELRVTEGPWEMRDQDEHPILGFRQFQWQHQQGYRRQSFELKLEGSVLDLQRLGRVVDSGFAVRLLKVKPDGLVKVERAHYERFCDRRLQDADGNVNDPMIVRYNEKKEQLDAEVAAIAAAAAEEEVAAVVAAAAVAPGEDARQGPAVPPLPDDCNYHFFISKHEEHKFMAKDIATELERRGYKVWISQGQSNKREDIDHAGMQKGVRESAVLLLLLSRGIFKRSRAWVTHTEVKYAVQQQKPVICVGHNYDFDTKCYFQLENGEESVHLCEQCEGVSEDFQPYARAINDMECVSWHTDQQHLAIEVDRIATFYSQRRPAAVAKMEEALQKHLDTHGKKTGEHRRAEETTSAKPKAGGGRARDQ